MHRSGSYDYEGYENYEWNGPCGLIACAKCLETCSIAHVRPRCHYVFTRWRIPPRAPEMKSHLRLLAPVLALLCGGVLAGCASEYAPPTSTARQPTPKPA